ncbi:hypothetical protein ACF0H5_015909 [Mactra antiquata]
MDLLRSFMLRFLKGTVVDELKTGKKMKQFNVESSECQRSDLEVGQSTQKVLDKKPDLAKRGDEHEKVLSNSHQVSKEEVSS